MADYKIQLGIDFIGDNELKNIKKQLTNLTDNTHRVRIDIDNSRLLKQIEHAKKELKGLGGTKSDATALNVNTKSVESSLNRVADSIDEIRKSLNTLDGKSGMQSLVASVNQIASALGKATDESETLVKTLSALGKKDFSVNLGLNVGGSNNPIARNAAYGNKVRSETLPQLKQQAEALVKYVNDYYKTSYNELEALQKLVHGTKLGTGDFYQNFLFGEDSVASRMSGGSLAGQMQAFKQFIDMFKQAASLKGLKLDSVTSQFSKSADELIKDAQDIQSGANEAKEGFEKLRGIFSGSGVDADVLTAQLTPIVEKLEEIRIALNNLSNADSLGGLTVSFDKLSGTLETLLANAKQVQDVLGSSGANIDSSMEAQKAADTVVQAEERKQQAIRETANIIREVSKISPNDAQIVNIMSSNIIKAAEKAGIDLEDYYRSLQDINAFQPTNVDVAAIADASEPIVNQLGIEAYNGYIKKMREIAEVNGQIVEDINASGKELAQSSTQSANTVVQAEERKQQAIKETRRLISDSAQSAIDAVTSKSINAAFEVDESDSDAFKREMENLVSQWTNARGKLTDIKIGTESFYDKDTNRYIEKITRAQVTYNNELGETIKKNIALRKIGEEQTGVKYDKKTKRNVPVYEPIYGFVETTGQYSKSLGKTKTQTDAFVKQQKQAIASLTNQINQMNRAAADQNAARPIKLDSHLTSLADKYNEITVAIQRMEGASSDTFVDEQNNVKKLISEFKSLVSEYKNAENVSTKMKGTDLQSGVNIALNDLKKFEAEAKDYPKLVNTVNKLKESLNEVGDTSSLNAFNDQLRVARSELAKIKSETAAANRTEKVGINVSGLQSKIADLQRISPEIDKFEAEIDGAKVSVQSLLSDLKQVNTQSDFSVVNSKWKAFTDAVKAAGIAVTETATKARTALANDIKFDIEVGNFDNEIDTMIANFNSLSDANDDLRRSYDATKDAYKAMMDAADANTGDEVADRERLIQAEKEYAAALEKTNNLIKKQARADRVAEAKQRLEDNRELFQGKIDAWMEKNSAATKKFGAQLLDLRAKAENADQVELNHLEKEFLKIDRAADKSGLKMQSLGDQIKSKFKEYMAYFSVAEVFMYVEQALSSMFEQVKLIDSAMTELKKVTDETDASYDRFLTNAASRAKEIGTTIDGLVSSTADFARLGYDFADAQGLAEVANIYAVVGDEVEGVEGATQSLISTMAAFKDEMNGLDDADFALSIVDKLNEVANNYSITSGGLGEALQRSASSLQTGNNTLDESISLITAANEVVQNPEKVGNAMKTISMRIRSAKSEMEEMGEDTDGMVESTATLREEIKALSGVDIMASATEFKSTYQILDELSQKWEDLNDISRATIIEKMAGKHQGNVFASLMENFDTARNALETSLNSAGSAMKEHEKWQQSLEAEICLVI